MTNANDTASPTVASINHGGQMVEIVTAEAGLTKREHFAALAMAAYNANYHLGGKNENEKAIWAVKDADALINELNKTD